MAIVSNYALFCIIFFVRYVLNAKLLVFLTFNSFVKLSQLLRIKHFTWRKFLIFFFVQITYLYKLFFSNTLYFPLRYMTSYRHEVDTSCFYDYDNYLLIVCTYRVVCYLILYYWLLNFTGRNLNFKLCYGPRNF